MNEIQLKNTLSIKDIEKDLDFSIREKILYFILGLPLPNENPTENYFKLGNLKISAKESAAELVSIYYTKIQDRKFKKLEIMFDYIDKKYSKTKSSQEKKVYESNSQALKDYQNQLEKIIELPTQINRDIAIQEYLKARLINYPEFLTFFDKNPLFLNDKNEVVYTYLNKNFPLFFKYALGLHTKNEIDAFKSEYKPNLKGYKKFIKNYSSEDNKLSFALNQQSVPVFIARQTLLEYNRHTQVKKIRDKDTIKSDKNDNFKKEKENLKNIQEIKSTHDIRKQNTKISIPDPTELKHEEKTKKEKENFLDSLF